MDIINDGELAKSNFTNYARERLTGHEQRPTDLAAQPATIAGRDMQEEYRAIVDAGFILQIDDPDLPDAWQMHPEMDVAAYRRFAGLRIEALNRALRDITVDRIREQRPIPYETANPVHEHDWTVWQETKLPDGKILIPGVVGSYCGFVEHPELIAERLVKYANLVARENVIAATDCGIGARVGHSQIGWAKFEAMAEGARLATKQLWGP